jgi:hypothetical protein
VQINKVRALAGGVTTGDTAGYPVTISESGSYRLTSDLDISVAASPTSTHVLDVTAPWVTIDLNGFAIKGSNDCTYTEGAGVTCNLSDDGGNGIMATGQVGLTVKNGTIRGMAHSGIHGSTSARIDGVTLWDNGSTCVLVSGNSYVNNVSATNCNGDGLFFHAGSLVTNSTFRENDIDGVECNTGHCLYRGNTVVSLGRHGLFGNYSDGYLVHDNTIHDVESGGIRMGGGANIYANKVEEAGGYGILGFDGSLIRENAVTTTGGNGIYVFASGMALNNAVRLATDYGIQLSADCAFGGNVLYENNSSGSQTLSGVEIRSNYCQSNLTCP